jgi:transposase
MRYSNDLRSKVIELLKSGKKQTEVSKLLNLSRSSIARWHSRYIKTGTANYIINKKSLESNKINDLDKFKEFIDSNSDKSLLELQHLWTNYKGNNRKVTYGTLYYVIVNKLGYTFKKNLGYIKKEMKN